MPLLGFTFHLFHGILSGNQGKLEEACPSNLSSHNHTARIRAGRMLIGIMPSDPTRTNILPRQEKAGNHSRFPGNPNPTPIFHRRIPMASLRLPILIRGGLRRLTTHLHLIRARCIRVLLPMRRCFLREISSRQTIVWSIKPRQKGATRRYGSMWGLLYCWWCWWQPP